MHPQTPDFEAVYVGHFPANDETDLKLAIAWAMDRSAEHKCGFTVVAPTREHFHRRETLSRLPRLAGQETSRTLFGARVEPVVVLCWPDEKTLAGIERKGRVLAVCVVPWLEAQFEPWRIARQAVDLLEPTRPIPTAELGDPVVRAAMKSLTNRVNLSTGILHPSDHDAAVSMFRLLRQGGYQFDPVEIKTWAMANGWRAEHADELAQIADRIRHGRTVRMNPRSRPWRDNVLDIWRSDATTN
jgi:hypothetical protein